MVFQIKRSLNAWRVADLVFYFVLLALGGCAPQSMAREGSVGPDKFAEVKNRIARLRGLNFKHEVSLEVKDREAMRGDFETALERDYGEQKLRNMALAYARLGLYPDALDLKNALLDFYSVQVAAFYDAAGKKLVLPEDLATTMLSSADAPLELKTMVGDMVLAHELTHALQDQHFSLQDRLRPSKDDDERLAFHAVAEGDATLAGFGYLFQATDDQFLTLMGQTVQDSMRAARSGLTGVPDAIVEELLFQYYGGVSFVSRLLRDKGWPGVNQLYRAPPLSTEQVLHPEKFFDTPDRPVSIELKGLCELFGPDWSEIENNVLGELMIQVLFRRFFGEEQASKLAAGWDGDRFIAFRRGDEVAFIWATAWDSPQEAEEFVRGYQAVVAKKYTGASEAAARVYVEQRGHRVTVVEGLDRSRVAERIEKIWREMELKEKPLPGGSL